MFAVGDFNIQIGSPKLNKKGKGIASVTVIKDLDTITEKKTIVYVSCTKNGYPKELSETLHNLDRLEEIVKAKSGSILIL